MGDKTEISWTDSTWNPVVGCTKVSTGCKFCYAERVSKRMGKEFTEVTLHPERLDQPLRWRKSRKIFVCSMSDLFHEDVPDTFILDAVKMMRYATQHTYQILTKRPERMRQFISAAYVMLATSNPDLPELSWPLPNVWLGISAENQEQADKRIPLLLQTPAAVRFVSLEPLLGSINLDRYLWASGDDGEPSPRNDPYTPSLHWIIVGGESGGPPERALVERESWHGQGGMKYGPWVPKPDALEWVRGIRDRCVAAGISFLHKQWGGPTPKSGGRVLDGKIWHQFPDEN